MAAQNFMTTLKNLFYSGKRSFESAFFHRQTFSEKYRSHLIGGAVALMAIVIGFGAYKWYKNNLNNQAQLAFSQAVASYNKALQSKDNQGWDDVAQLLKEGAHSYKNSVFAPYFKTFYADVLIKQDKRDLALVEISDAVRAMPASSALTSLFKIKEALLMIDAGTPDQQKQGVENLTSLAHTPSNIFADQAGYHLAQYYWSIDDTQKAREEWQHLAQVSAGTKESRMNSPWASHARSMLENFS